MQSDSDSMDVQSRRSLTFQLRIALAAALLLVAGVSATTLWITRLYQRDIAGAYETHLRAASQLAEAESALWQLRWGLAHFMAANDEERTAILAAEKSLYDIVESRLAVYVDTAETVEEKTAATSLRSLYQRYKSARPKVFELWKAGDKDGALAWRELTTIPFGAETSAAFAAQIALQRRAADEGRATTVTEVRRAFGLTLAIALSMLVMIVIGYVKAVRALGPILALRNRAESVLSEQFGERVEFARGTNEVTALVASVDTMATRLLSQAAELKASRERLDLLVRTSPAVIYASTVGEHHTITFVGANIRGQLGYLPTAFTDDPHFWIAQIHPDDRNRVIEGLLQSTQSDRYMHEYRLRHNLDGTWRWILDEMATVRDAAGVPVEQIGYWIDITGRKETEHNLVVANRELEGFSYTISHDLKAPLRSINGYSQLLLSEHADQLDDTGKRFLGNISKSALLMDRLIRELLDYAMLDQRQLQTSTISLPELIRKVVEEYADDIHASKTSLNISVVDAHVRADAEALSAALRNLIGNAIKFCRNAATPEIYIGSLEGEHAVTVTVRDNGMGFDMKYHDQIFTIFKRLHHDSGVDGTGVGLAIVRRMMERLGGRVWAQSEVGKGATFYLEIPK